MNAVAWFYSLPGVHDHAEPKPREVPSGTPRVGQTTAHEYWDGKQWRERLLVWDGEKYAEVAA